MSSPEPPTSSPEPPTQPLLPSSAPPGRSEPPSSAPPDRSVPPVPPVPPPGLPAGPPEPPPGRPLAPPPYPARSRRAIPVLVPHLIWEPVLLVLTAGVIVVAAVRTPLLEGEGMWWTMAYLGLLASALALSLRTATPNLAVAGVAAGSGAGYGWLVVEGDLPVLLAAGVVVLGALVLGAVLGVVTGLTSAPAWAVSLAGLAAMQALVLVVIGAGTLNVTERLPGPLGSVWFWFAAFLLVSLAGGVVFAIPQVRRLLSANRAATDPVRFGGDRLLGALVGFAGSSLLASLAGLALVEQLGVVFGGTSDASLLYALAAVLIGGVSVFGGRGGIAGTVLGVALLAALVRWFDLEGPSGELARSGRWIAIVVLILAGVALGRLLEALAPARPSTNGGQYW